QLPREEVGQGITTAIAMLIADEMGIPLASGRMHLQPATPSLLFNQITGGSNSVRSLYTPVRTVAAAAKGRLTAAAAGRLGVAPAKLAGGRGAGGAPGGGAGRADGERWRAAGPGRAERRLWRGDRGGGRSEAEGWPGGAEAGR